MLAALRRAMTQPAAFFEDEAHDPGVRRPAAVVGLIAVIGLLSTLPILLTTLSALPAGANVFVAVGLLIGALAGLFGPFIVWLVYAGLFYLLSLAFDGTGSFRDLFAVTGWGFAPRVISSLIGAAILFIAVSGTNFTDPAQAQQFQQSFPTSPLGLISQGISIIISLWSAWMWTHAVANARELTTKQAGIVVGVIVTLGILGGLAGAFLV